MAEKKILKIRKIVTILLMVCFLASVTATAVSAAHDQKMKEHHNDHKKKVHYNDHKKRGHHQQNLRHHGDRINKHSADYKLGHKDGKKAGYNDGRYDYDNFFDYQENYDDSLTSIPIAVNKKNNYIAGYEAGYEVGYDKGYP